MLTSASIPERDWKVFRELRELALQRFCERVLSSVAAAAASGGTPHERYLKVFEIITTKDKELARLFNDPRRSTAWDQLCLISAAGLLNAEEMDRFSPDTRESVSLYTSHLTKR